MRLVVYFFMFFKMYSYIKFLKLDMITLMGIKLELLVS